MGVIVQTAVGVVMLCAASKVGGVVGGGACTEMSEW